MAKKKTRKINPKYLPNTLTKSDKNKQKKSIINGKNRPKLKSYKSKRSGWAVKFENKYGEKITNKKFINKTILSHKGIKEILDKGMAAYYTSGSRPNQSKESWAFARLASVIMGGPARKVDKNIWEQYKKI